MLEYKQYSSNLGGQLDFEFGFSCNDLTTRTFV